MSGTSLRQLVVAHVVLGAILFVVAWVFSESDEGVGEILGAAGWFGMWFCVLGLLVLGVVALVHRIRRPAAA